MIERTLPIDRMENVINVFGSFDQNLRIIENELGVRVTDRDDQLRISGEPEDVMTAEKAMYWLMAQAVGSWKSRCIRAQRNVCLTSASAARFVRPA